MGSKNKICSACGQTLPPKPRIEKKPKIEKFKGTVDDWADLAAQKAISFCPTIFHCKHCDYPVVNGYCCEHCGSVDPGNPDDDGESTAYLFL